MNSLRWKTLVPLVAAVLAGCDGVSVVGGGFDAAPDAPDVPALDARPMDAADVVDVQDVLLRCTSNAGCAGNPAGAVCDVVNGRCVQCVATADTCPAGAYCDAATNRCAQGCRNDDGCAPGVGADAGVADAGDAGASRNNRCNVATRTCVECLNDAQCPAGTLCAGNVCAPGCNPGRACPTGQTCCNSACVDTSANLANCGACGTRCEPPRAAPACMAGACAVASCLAPFGDCDANAANGCEVDTSRTVAHCGGCGMACAARPGSVVTCEMGACAYACAPGFGDCDGDATNGCEVEFATSLAHCGRCNNACAFTNAAASCAFGACALGACNAGFGNCDGNAANGCETDTRTSLTNCGACGTTCAARPNAAAACAASTCGLTCNAGFGNCDGNATNGCETDTRTSLTNCGACGTICPARTNAAATCAASTCGLTCNAGFGNCDNNAANGCETDTRTSVTNCGACGNICATGASCTAGACVTLPTCTDRIQNGTESDVDCGGTCPGCLTGNACRNNTDCRSGTCTTGACTTPTCSTCFDTARNGTETDVNCGGPDCDARCVVGSACTQNSDCLSGVCTSGRCAGTDPTTNNNGGGGGGGQTHCWAASGGAGSYGTAGGVGGNNTVCTASVGGTAGATYGVADLARVFVGSGGGGGGDDYRDPSWEGLDGGSGGGIVLIFAGSVSVTGSVSARGVDGFCQNGTLCLPGGGFDGGGGGGGAGGSVLIRAATATLGGGLVRAGGGLGGVIDTTPTGGGLGGNGRVAGNATTATGTTPPAAVAGPPLAAQGTGADGAANLSTNTNLNTAIVATGRTAPDGEAFPVSAIGATTITVGGAGTGNTAANSVGNSIRVGDAVLLINLRGAPAQSASVGAYEVLTVTAVSGATVTVDAVANTYGAGGNANLDGQSVMLQRVPNYTTVTVGQRLTASAFDGRVGGVVAFRATGAVTVTGSIDVSGLGYRGGAAGRQCDNCGRQGESFNGRGNRVCRTGPI